MAIPDRWRKYLVIVGGVLVHLTLGTVYTFGNLNPYLTSYIRKYSSPGNLQYGESVWIFSMSGMGQGLSMFLGGVINRYIGPRLTTLLGSMLMSAGVLLTYVSVQHSFVAVVFTYGLMFGLGVGIAYAVPMACAMKWLPEKKGLVSGCVVAGFGGGAFIFLTRFRLAYINHNNLKPQIDETDGGSYFTQPEVLDKVPKMFLILGACYIVMQLIGIIFISEPPPVEVRTTYVPQPKGDGSDESVNVMDVTVNPDGEDSETKALIPAASSDEEGGIKQEETPAIREHTGVKDDEHAVLHPKQMLKQRAFYILWFIFLFNGQGVVFFSSLYKAYGQTFIQDDVFLATVGAFGAVFNAAGRIAWGYFADKVSFKVSMTCLCALFTVLLLTIGLTSLAGKWLFFLYVCLIFGTFSGNFSLFPVATARSFGQLHYPLNYGLLFTSQVITAPVGAVLTSQLKGIIGWYGMFFVVSGFSFSSFILMFVFQVKNSKGKDV
ncbi:oxalate:formate antiporter-like isoform X2 [Haliotis rubra]|uniref:oxalate:formate antiporter-like isoform X2 n=1 Tax=Haliotis rubra TaxID=36100 RepID=UPI001EE51AB5|nr:oxalate:formate antiporter-like isoform X2 [Haliotis rubra]